VRGRENSRKRFVGRETKGRKSWGKGRKIRASERGGITPYGSEGDMTAKGNLKSKWKTWKSVKKE